MVWSLSRAGHTCQRLKALRWILQPDVQTEQTHSPDSVNSEWKHPKCSINTSWKSQCYLYKYVQGALWESKCTLSGRALLLWAFSLVWRRWKGTWCCYLTGPYFHLFYVHVSTSGTWKDLCSIHTSPMAPFPFFSDLSWVFMSFDPLHCVKETIFHFYFSLKNDAGFYRYTATYEYMIPLNKNSVLFLCAIKGKMIFFHEQANYISRQ